MLEDILNGVLESTILVPCFQLPLYSYASALHSWTTNAMIFHTSEPAGMLQWSLFTYRYREGYCLWKEDLHILLIKLRDFNRLSDSFRQRSQSEGETCQSFSRTVGELRI